jgi:hypothetical protein
VAGWQAAYLLLLAAYYSLLLLLLTPTIGCLLTTTTYSYYKLLVFKLCGICNDEFFKCAEVVAFAMMIFLNMLR